VTYTNEYGAVKKGTFLTSHNSQSEYKMLAIIQKEKVSF
jgi:hypothetical protein